MVTHMGILENPKKYYTLAGQMRAMAEDEADPFHAERLRRVALAYEKRAWAIEEQIKTDPENAALMLDAEPEHMKPGKPAKLRLPSRASAVH